MSRVLYFDCYAGAAGDMILGALIDAGVPIDDVRAALGSLTIGGYEIVADRVLRAGVSAAKFRLIEDDRTGSDPHTPRAQHEAAAASRGPTESVHSHPHEHVHEHQHEHPHGHSHEPAGALPHTHQHSHAHEHPHDHAHAHEHLHGHEHEHGHQDEHQHQPADQRFRGRQQAHEHEQAVEHANAEAAELVTGQGHGVHRSLSEINRLIESSALGEAARKRAVAMFRRLAEAEAEVHQVPVERIHLHEVGSLDSIVDIVGTVFAMERFAPARVVSSPLNVGGGTIRSAHGLFPVPAPATVRLLSGVPVYSSGVRTELVTPTGALLVTEYASSFGPIPPMTIQRVGYGAGDKDIPSFPNSFRVLVGEEGPPGAGDRVVVIESAIDDMNPQIFGSVMEKLYAAGALEVYYQSVQMKKNRPGTLVTIIAPPDRRPSLARVMFRKPRRLGYAIRRQRGSAWNVAGSRSKRSLAPSG